jgi:hypothetical protein
VRHSIGDQPLGEAIALFHAVLCELYPVVVEKIVCDTVSKIDHAEFHGQLRVCQVTAIISSSDLAVNLGHDIKEITPLCLGLVNESGIDPDPAAVDFG